MKRAISLMSLPILALVACTPMGPQAVSQLGSSPVLDGGSYSTGGGITIAAEIQNSGGMTALCGVWAESKRQSALSRGKAAQVVATGSAYVNGSVLHRGLLFMQKVDAAEGYGGLAANCIVTDRTWQAGDRADAVQIRIPRQVVHREDDDIDGGGPVVVFRQTGPGA